MSAAVINNKVMEMLSTSVYVQSHENGAQAIIGQTRSQALRPVSFRSEINFLRRMWITSYV